MQGYTQPKLHPGAQQAMQAGTGGLHQPQPKQPSLGASLPTLRPSMPAAPAQPQVAPQLSPLAQKLMQMRQHPAHPSMTPGKQIVQQLMLLQRGMR